MRPVVLERAHDRTREVIDLVVRRFRMGYDAIHVDEGRLNAQARRQEQAEHGDRAT